MDNALKSIFDQLVFEVPTCATQMLVVLILMSDRSKLVPL